MRKRILLSGIPLLGLWLLFSVDASRVSLFLGALISCVTIIFFSRFSIIKYPHGSRKKKFFLISVVLKIFFFIVFLPLFFWKVVRSGLYIAFLALKPSMDFWPGIVKIKGNLPNLTAITALANLITLTPGTLTMDYDEKSDDLYVHCIDVTEYGGEGIDEAITAGMRPWVRRIFG